MAHVANIQNAAAKQVKIAVLLLTGVILLALAYFGMLYFLSLL
jgi:hypothetical protein